jgi:hypothetical protein
LAPVSSTGCPESSTGAPLELEEDELGSPVHA